MAGVTPTPNTDPTFSQITLRQAVDAALGKDKNKPEPTYEFTGRTFTTPINRNPYTGATS